MSDLFTINSVKHGHKIIFGPGQVLLPLPTLFCREIRKVGVVIKGLFGGEPVFGEITEGRAKSHENSLCRFLEYAADEPDTLKFHHRANELLNYYINDYLVEEESKGYTTVNDSKVALTYYYNFLQYYGFIDKAPRIFLRPRLRIAAKQNAKISTCPKYLTPKLRNLLYKHADSLRDEILLRTGAELGLRSSENLGLRLIDQTINRTIYPGLLSLFSQMVADPDKESFDYYLSFAFVKGAESYGMSRVLKIHRSLLAKMKRYYDHNRPESKEECLFLNESHNAFGETISKCKGTAVFRYVKEKILQLQADGCVDVNIQKIHQHHSYHILRHSFGTDLWYDTYTELGGKPASINKMTDINLNVWDVVSERMGHNKTGQDVSTVTRGYVQSCDIRKQLLEHEEYA
jgi:integrase